MGADRIERVAAQGRANQANFRLVENWCAHIRIERWGGVGMIEKMTGDPIGHFGPACDHAGADGMMSWDIRDSAIDFYDRHCSKCTLRQPVRDPNLSQWVAQRDAVMAEQRTKVAAAEQAAADAAALRRQERQALRAELLPAALDVVEQLDEMDGPGAREHLQRFVLTARLAPEAFPEPVREHLFSLLEARQGWAQDAALAALTELRADPQRTARFAAQALSEGNDGTIPIRALVRSLPAASEADVAAAFNALVEVADPQREPFSEIRRPRPGPLVLVARAFPEVVKARIAALFSEGTPRSVSVAARAVKALARRAPSLSMGFTRDLVSALVRAKWMPGRHDLERDEALEAARDVETAILVLFRKAPDAIDNLLQKFLVGASSEGETRVYRTYHWIFSKRSYDEKGPADPAERLAFIRLFRAAPTAINWDVLNEIIQGIHNRPERYAGLAEEFTDELLGAAIAMNERLVAFDAEPEATTLLDSLERGNRRNALWRLRSTFVAWAAAGVAAKGDPSAYVSVMQNIPEARDSFAGCMVEHSVRLATSVDGLNAILPSLYSGLVGASAYRRGAAATAIGKLPARLRRHAPDLLFEAFIPTLTDPYRHVHGASLKALERMTLPDALKPQVRHAVSALVAYYGERNEEPEMVVDGIEILVGDHLSEAERAGRPGAYLVAQLARLEWWRFSSSIVYLARQLGRAKGLVDLLLKRLSDPNITDHDIHDVLDALGGVPNEVLYEHRAALAAVPAGSVWEVRRRVHGLVELLSRCGAWKEAVELAERAIAEIPDTRRERGQRQLMQLLASATRYELALASGDETAAAAAAESWRELHAQMGRGRDAA
ncbi:hypothetical protein [Phenylobacterium conjunctum]|uniref:HEAT repeat domain-containing protein n=1 Tax=Phenylobacterium conjunctum TaxID=1298959 RepID=A0ABW3T7H1_9CAUL